MFPPISSLTNSVGGLVVFGGAINDFKEKKYRNSLFIASSLLGFAVSIWFNGWIGLQQSVLGFVGGFALCLPLVLAKAVGAGDMKLLAAYGSTATWTAVLSVGIFSLIWGALFGITLAILQGQGRALLQNTFKVATIRKPEQKSLHKIPFAGAIFLGWLTYISLAVMGGAK